MSDSRLQFRLEATATGSRARAARFRTRHNEVLTPVFMPVGTQATVKAQPVEVLEACGSQVLLANTYHLLLRPGPEVFERSGGIHGFMRWDRSVLTDSGGYQIFSLPHSRSMSESGAVFQSYVDGRAILLSPELSIQTQRSIGSDIMMVLDQCIPSTAGAAQARAALEITQRWAVRSLAARGDSPQALFAIMQGALFPELRRESADGLTALPFDGFAIGGLAVGEGKSEREDICAMAAALLPADRPRYLMGVGTPLDLLEAVHRGVDMFDCIIPTQLAKRGSLFTSRGLVQFRRSVYKFSQEPPDPDCPCPTCAKYTRAYLHHLTKTGETLGWQLMGQHNLHYYHRLMREIRQSILNDTFLSYYHAMRPLLAVEDVDNPSVRPPAAAPVSAPALGAYEIHTAAAGFSSIRHRASGEIMHSVTPPIEEARTLYIAQSRLSERLREAAAEPLVIWDVGLGAAANAMAAIQCYEELAAARPPRPLHIVSFENDLDSLRLAVNHRRRFPYLQHGAPAALLAHGHWRAPAHPGLSWQLVPGAFQDVLAAAPARPDLIFFDMFSARTHAAEWSVEAFARLFRALDGHPAELFTYSTSTAVRVALLAAGFHVARGCATGVKTETTIALTPARATAAPHPLLGPDWLARWEKSHARYPASLPAADRPGFDRLIAGHPQFQRPSPVPSGPESRPEGHLQPDAGWASLVD
jgi:queuine tRNA-ribosyltransferase